MIQPKFQKWYNWPEYYYKKTWNPWHQILRKLIFLPLFLLAFALFYISLVLLEGIQTAEEMRKHLF